MPSPAWSSSKKICPSVNHPAIVDISRKLYENDPCNIDYFLLCDYVNTNGLVKKHIIMLRSLKLKVKYLVLVAYLLLLFCCVKNKRPNVSDVVKKTNYDTKIPDTESKYLTALDNYKFTGEILKGTLMQI